jgi:hypothetical protein
VTNVINYWFHNLKHLQPIKRDYYNNNKVCISNNGTIQNPLKRRELIDWTKNTHGDLER